MNSSPGLIALRFRIGVTGHRWEVGRAPASVVEDVHAAIDRIVELLALDPTESTPVTTTVVSALAEGADRLVAHDVLARPGTRLEVILPFEPSVYLADFAEAASREEFEELLSRASATMTVQPRKTRPLTYREAGEQMVDRCDIVVAVWDGEQGDIGGTSDVVGSVRKRGLPMVWVDARAGGFVEEVGGVVRPLTNEDVCPLRARAFARLDRYNREHVPVLGDASLIDGKASEQAVRNSVAFGDDRVRRVLDWAQPYYARAENVARAWQRRYEATEVLLYLCSSLAVFVVAAQVAFFPGHNEIVLAEAALLAFAILVLWTVRRRRLHDRWISARHLAEWIRASFFVRATGLPVRASLPGVDDASDPEGAWVGRARLEIACEQPEPSLTEADVPQLRTLLSQFWVEHQHRYFERAAKRNEQRDVTLRRVTAALLACSIVFALLHALSIGDEDIEHIWVFGSITLPVVGAAVHAIATARDYRRHARRYDVMARELALARPSIDAAHGLRGLRTAAANVEHVVTREAQDWFGDVRLKDPELPF